MRTYATKQHCLSYLIQHNHGSPEVLVRTIRRLVTASSWTVAMKWCGVTSRNLSLRVVRIEELLGFQVWVRPFSDNGRYTQEAVEWLSTYDSLPEVAN